MNLEELLRVKDNTSENGDDEYLEFQNTIKNDHFKTQNHLPFKPYVCFHRYEYQENG
jgi:hypothetical protein